MNQNTALSNLSDTELLSAVTRRSKQACRAELAKHESLHGIAVNTTMIDAHLELARRYLYQDISRGQALSSPDDTRRYLRIELQGEKAEVFACMFMDNRNRVINFDRLFYGTIDGASVYPREVVRKAMDYNAAAVIFAHNHPSGVAEPSRADENITRRLKEALALIDVRVLDHFIVGDDVVSFAERGIL